MPQSPMATAEVCLQTIGNMPQSPTAELCLQTIDNMPQSLAEPDCITRYFHSHNNCVLRTVFNTSLPLENRCKPSN
jgi:hypothetical protein